MKNEIQISLLIIAALLSGCSTIDKTECLASDWEQIGLDDGKRGIAATSTSSYIERCSGQELTVDMNAYNQGHQKGVALFCQTDNGFDLGEDGFQYTVKCPTAFEQEYKIGYQFYVANSNLHKVEQALLTNENNITKLNSSISNANLELTSDDLSTSEQIAIRQNIEAMTSQIEGHEQAIERIEPALHQMRQQLEAMKAAHSR